MSPFVQVPMGHNPLITPEALCETLGKPPTAENLARAAASLMKIRNEEAGSTCWLNDTYQVVMRPLPSDEHGAPYPMVHLSIKRVDREVIHDWRDLQEIKNQLVGPECEAVELYPAESRKVDAANQYHLWALAKPGVRFPLGWNEGRMVTDKSLAGSKNRPL